MRLSTQTHDRDAAQLTYVYPVISRRAQGVSIGINLNPNNACNWRCAYCQVPGLTSGNGPALDLDLLDSELRGFLVDVLEGDWMEQHVPEGSRRLNDLAFSGNGEATTSPQFQEAVEVVARVWEDTCAEIQPKTILITNGSQTHKQRVQAGLERLRTVQGEVWFKLDSGTRAGRLTLNGTRVSDERVIENLVHCCSRVPTRLQTLRLATDGSGPSPEEDHAWESLVKRALEAGANVQDVLLYGLEREVMQPGAERLSKLSTQALIRRGRAIEQALNLKVTVHP